MATLDVWYLVLLAATLAADHLLIWRRFARQAAVRPRQARLVLWKSWIGMLWWLALGVCGLWILEGRRWELLGLASPAGWRLWASAGLLLAVFAMYASTVARLFKIDASRKATLRDRFGSHAAMLPQTRPELAWFAALSLSAGVCEELVFRGYLVWAFQPVLGLWGAAVASCIAFALAHAYQGAKGVLGTGVIGTLLMAVVLASGSLLPAIALHALIDVAQGVVAWLVLRGDPQAGTGEPAAPPLRA